MQQGRDIGGLVNISAKSVDDSKYVTSKIVVTCFIDLTRVHSLGKVIGVDDFGSEPESY